MARIRPPVEREVENGKFISTVKLEYLDANKSGLEEDLFIWVLKYRLFGLFENTGVLGRLG